MKSFEVQTLEYNMKSLPLEVAGDVPVIAGDVGYLVDPTIPHLILWKRASDNFRHLTNSPLRTE